ncbi:unnamed protein product [Lampetra fluviatilis]
MLNSAQGRVTSETSSHGRPLSLLEARWPQRLKLRLVTALGQRSGSPVGWQPDSNRQPVRYSKHLAAGAASLPGSLRQQRRRRQQQRQHRFKPLGTATPRDPRTLLLFREVAPAGGARSFRGAHNPAADPTAPSPTAGHR